MLGAKANRAAKQTSPEVHSLGLFAFILIAKHIVIVAVLSCMRWRSSAPSRQLHETELITGKSISRGECGHGLETEHSALSVVVNVLMAS